MSRLVLSILIVLIFLSCACARADKPGISSASLVCQTQIWSVLPTSTPPPGQSLKPVSPPFKYSVLLLGGSGAFLFFLGFVVLNSTIRRRITTNLRRKIVGNAPETGQPHAMLESIADIFAKTENSASIGFWEYDLRTRESYASKAICQIFGIPERSKIDPQEALSFYRPDSREVVIQVYRNLLEKNESYDVELAVVSKNGKETWVRAIGYPVFESGMLVKARGILMDIDQAKRAQLELAKKEYTLKEAQAIASIGNFDFDILQNKLEWSDQMYEIFGMTKENFGASFEAFMEIVHPEDRKKVNENLLRAITEFAPHDVEHRIIRPDGQIRRVRERAKVYYNDENVAIRVVGTTQDVTDEQQLLDHLGDNLRYQGLLADVGLALNTTDNYTSRVARALEIIGTVLQLSNVYIVEREQGGTCRVGQQWTYVNDPHNERHGSASFLSTLPGVVDLLGKVDYLYTDQSTELDHMIRNIFGAEIKGLMVSPMCPGEEIQGFIVFEDKKERRKWSSPERRALNTATGIIANVELERATRNQLALSEQKYKALYDQTPAMMHSIDSKGVIISVSDFWLDKMGYRMEEVLGRKSLEFLTDASARYARETILPQFMKTGCCRNVQYQFVKKSGEVMDVLLSAISEKNKQGEFVRSLAVLTDITPEKKAEQEIVRLNESLEKKVRKRTRELESLSEELMSQKHLLESVVSNTSNLVFVKDLSGTYLMANDQMARYHGLTPGQMIGKTDYEFYEKSDADRFERINQAVITNREPQEYEESVIFDDHLHTFLVIKSPLFDEQGKVTGICAVATDITRQKDQQAQLELQAEELRVSNTILTKQQKNLIDHRKKLLEANQELESFSYSVSHDLRSPLRSLEGFSQLMLDNYQSEIDERGQKWLKLINTNAIRMDALINDILAFSKISRAEISRCRFDMKQLVQEVIREEQKAYPNHKIDIKIENLAEAYGDPRILRQVWVNLVSNAFKYSSKNKFIKIQITGKKEEKKVLYSITDNGVGFEPEYSDKLFGVFQRLHHDSEFEGTGVGLAIVEKIIKRHGGEVHGTGKPGDGATFTFSLLHPHRDAQVSEVEAA